MFVQKNVVNVNAYVANGKFWIFVEGTNSIEESLFVENLVEPYLPEPQSQPPTATQSWPNPSVLAQNKTNNKTQILNYSST